jgi:hypothetical protein
VRPALRDAAFRLGPRVEQEAGLARPLVEQRVGDAVGEHHVGRRGEHRFDVVVRELAQHGRSVPRPGANYTRVTRYRARRVSSEGTEPASNPFRERLPVVIGGVAVFAVLLVVTAITQENALGSVVAVYGIVGGVLLGMLLAKTERARRP